MFKFLFKRKGADVEAKIETQREQFERLTAELNGLMALQGEKPTITIDPASGEIGFVLPEQMADEALALPAPVEEAVEEVAEKAEDVADKAEDIGENVADAAKDAGDAALPKDEKAA